MVEIKQLETWMQETEGETLEFKQARNRFGLDELTEYAVALANEGGGKIILGVSDQRPRNVVGSTAFSQPEQTRGQLNQRLHLGISFDIVNHPDGRVLIFHIPSRPAGIPIQFRGKYLVRQDESLVGMSGERLTAIYAESGHDYSADICDGLSIDDLSDKAVEDFRKRWIAKSGNGQLAGLSKQQLLFDIEVATEEGVNFAGLVLFGTRTAVRKHLAQSEIVFEYRSTNAAGPAGQREEFTEGFFLYFDQLWNLVNLRNDKQHYEDGPFVLEVKTFQERAVREAILNAVSHRNYQLASNVFLRQYPERIEIDSPGGFAPEITPENILVRQSPRNRRIAEIFAKCGLVERAGQGVDLMYQLAIRDSKETPDYSKSDQFTVSVTLKGRVLNKAFVRFVLKCDVGALESLSTEQWLALDRLSREEQLRNCSSESVEQLLSLQLIERVSATRFILPRLYYEFLDRIDSYNRMREKEIKRELLESELQKYRVDGLHISDLDKILPDEERKAIRRLLKDLEDDNRVHAKGENRWTRYYPGPSEEDI